MRVLETILVLKPQILLLIVSTLNLMTPVATNAKQALLLIVPPKRAQPMTPVSWGVESETKVLPPSARSVKKDGTWIRTITSAENPRLAPLQMITHSAIIASIV